jgi:hypothetical protein
MHLSSPIYVPYAPSPHCPWFNHPNNMWWGYRSLSTSLCSLLHSPVTSSFAGPHTFTAPLSRTPSTVMYGLCPQSVFSNVRDRVSRSFKTGNIIALYILIFILFNSNLEGKKILNRMTASNSWLQGALTSSWMKFGFVRVVPKYLTRFTLSKDLLPIVTWANIYHNEKRSENEILKYAAHALNS